MHNLEVFTAKGYSSKTLRTTLGYILGRFKERDIKRENASAIY